MHGHGVLVPYRGGRVLGARCIERVQRAWVGALLIQDCFEVDAIMPEVNHGTLGVVEIVDT